MTEEELSEIEALAKSAGTLKFYDAGPFADAVRKAVAVAHEDVLKLLAEIRSLRAQLSRQQAELEDARLAWRESWIEALEVHELRVQFDKQREALTRITKLGDPTQGLYCGACGQTEHCEPRHLPTCVARAALEEPKT